MRRQSTSKSKRYATKGLACNGQGAAFKKMIIERNLCGDDDVELDIKFCGVCHDDVHSIMNHTGSTKYPIIPGHEITGVVTEVGDNVEKYEVGDTVGVGVIVESCMSCTQCSYGHEHLCEKGATATYGDEIKHSLLTTNSGNTFGGYSKIITVHQRFVINIPDALPLEYAAPLLCAGVAMYSPLKHFGAESGGKRVGVLGMGGLGQMGVKLAVAMGNEVTAISTSASKEAKCKELGAKQFILSTDPQSMKDASKSLDLILNTISAPHQCSEYLSLLAYDGTLVNLGSNLEPQNISLLQLVQNRNSIAGSSRGGIAETQECVDFCAKKKIKPEIEVIDGEKIAEVYGILDTKNDTVKRYVLDISKSF